MIRRFIFLGLGVAVLGLFVFGRHASKLCPHGDRLGERFREASSADRV